MNRKKRFFAILAILLVFWLAILPRTEGSPNIQPQMVVNTASLGETSPLDEETIEIDFTTALTVPDEFREPIQRAMQSAKSRWPAVNRFTVTALRESGSWMHAVLVPTKLVESGWHSGLKPEEIVEVLAKKDDTNQWVAYVLGTPEFLMLAREVPKDFIDFSILLNEKSANTAGTDYLFPWTSGQAWKMSNPIGWHETWPRLNIYNAIDFAPSSLNNPDIDLAVLASAPGRLTRICGPENNDPGQSALKIEHVDGDITYYLHLETSSIDKTLLGENVVQGQFLGRLYNPGGGFNTSCGKGTGTHLHFGLPRRDMLINGVNANSVANAYNTPYTSSNLRVDDNSPPDPAIFNFTVKLRNSSNLSDFNHSAEVALVILEPATQQILTGPVFVTTDSNGFASTQWTLSQPGTYDICAKARHYLGQCRRNVEINPGETINIDFSNGETTPAEPGDIDPYGGDNEINTLDSEMIKNEWRTYTGQSCPPCRFDMNRDGIFHAEDALLVIQRAGRDYRGEGNFGRPFASQRDDSTLSEGNEGSTRPSEASVGTGFVRVEPTNVTKSVGEVFDASLFFDTGGNAVTGSDVKVYYDPAVLEVLDEDPSTDGVQIINAGLFPNVYRNRVDSSEGVIWFSASDGNIQNDEQFNGSGTLATLRFRVLAGTPFSTQVYPVVESNTTNESNAAQFDTAFDVLGSAAISTYTLNGTERPEPSISLSVGSNSYLNETLLHVTAQVNEPYNQVDCVDFNLVSEFDVPVSVSDCEGGDGWSAFLDTSTLSDQTDVRMIGRVNLRTTQGDYSTTSENITLDRTIPNILSSNLTPSTPSPGESVEVEVEIDDNLSQQIHAEMWVNRANDSSAHGEWVRVDEAWIARSSSYPPFVDTMTWDTTGFDEGDHLIVITADDDAGTRNSWSSVQTVGSSATCAGQYSAEYYSNQTLSGNADFVQCESWPINHDWATNPPAPNIPGGNFSARWTGNATFQGGDYTFTYRSDDGMRAWLDNELIIDNWDNPSLNENRVTRYVSSGEHEIKVEYYESGGAAVAQFRWEQQAPTSCLGQFLAEYYSNQTLSGNADFVQCESWPINHDWATNPPAPNIPGGNFSARWTGNATFQGGDYTFTYRSDDGMRAWLDNELIIDNWDNPSLNENRVTRYVSSGEHEIKVEYYESGGAAVAQFRWEEQALTSCLGQFLAEYYSNQTLSGNADFVQCESWPINHDWTTNPPAPNIPSGNFSARWTAHATFQGDNYTFTYRSDDGMRAWLDNELIIDNWDCPSLNQYSVTNYVSSGEHEIKVEYYESGGAAVAEFGWESDRSHLDRRLDLAVYQLYLPAITIDSSKSCLYSQRR